MCCAPPAPTSPICSSRSRRSRCFGCGKPPLIASNCCFWSASAVDWSEDAVNVLERDIADETRAVQAYERAAKLVRSPSLSALLVRIAEDERLHVTLLTDALKTVAAK